MSRKQRKKSVFGVYHVMLRGINKQNIFFSEDDFVRMMNILHDAPLELDTATGKIQKSDLCTIYAYCILDNHLHLLIKEGTQCISDIMKSIEDRYAIYYNKKYERVGHLFQARFPSEPVNDLAYFYTLLRYIHRNPVKALEIKNPEEYPYSSWNEYVNHPSNILQVLKPDAIKAVIKKFPLEELTEWVELKEPNSKYSQDDIEKSDHCLDMDSFSNIISDAEAMEILLDISGCTNPEDFRILDAQTQIYHLLQAINNGVKLKQASRLGTITEYQLNKAFNKIHSSTSQNCGDSSRPGSVPEFEESPQNDLHAQRLSALKKAMKKIEEEDTKIKLDKYQQQVRQIEGLGTKTYHKLHLIVEFLSQHPASKCLDVAIHLDVSNESARRFLVRLANENIVKIQGKGKQCTYSLR